MPQRAQPGPDRGKSLIEVTVVHADLFAQVGGAAAAGAVAAAAINMDLVTEEAQEAAADCSEPSSAEARAQ